MDNSVEERTQRGDLVQKKKKSKKIKVKGGKNSFQCLEKRKRTVAGPKKKSKRR